MQLDALGLFLTAYSTLAATRLLQPDVRMLLRFVRYLGAIGYWQRHDLGHWEEWPPAVRTSSLGCCVAGLRAAAPLLVGCEDGGAPPPPPGGAACWAEEAVRLADCGWAAMQPRLGGEGSGGVAWEAEGRGDDAAMLTLLLPPLAAQLGLSPAQRAALVASALRLRRPHGVLRYEGDSYYGADYQARLAAWKADSGGGRGDPAAYPHASVRDTWAVPGCEAQWTIFEPLLLLHFLHLQAAAAEGGGEAGGEAARRAAADARRSFMRILAAIEEEGGAGAGGAEPRLHVHESYALVGGERGPNDVQDLLWAVAYIRMALAAVEEALRSGKVI